MSNKCAFRSQSPSGAASCRQVCSGWGGGTFEGKPRPCGTAGSGTAGSGTSKRCSSMPNVGTLPYRTPCSTPYSTLRTPCETPCGVYAELSATPGSEGGWAAVRGGVEERTAPQACVDVEGGSAEERKCKTSLTGTTGSRALEGSALLDGCAVWCATAPRGAAVLVAVECGEVREEISDTREEVAEVEAMVEMEAEAEPDMEVEAEAEVQAEVQAEVEGTAAERFDVDDGGSSLLGRGLEPAQSDLDEGAVVPPTQTKVRTASTVFCANR